MIGAGLLVLLTFLLSGVGPSLLAVLPAAALLATRGGRGEKDPRWRRALRVIVIIEIALVALYFALGALYFILGGEAL